MPPLPHVGARVHDSTLRTWTVEAVTARALTRPSSSAVAFSWSAPGTATDPGLMLLSDVAALLRMAVSAAELVMSTVFDACAVTKVLECSGWRWRAFDAGLKDARCLMCHCYHTNQQNHTSYCEVTCMHSVCATSMGNRRCAKPTCCRLRPADAGGGGVLAGAEDGDILPFNTAYTYSAMACMERELSCPAVNSVPVTGRERVHDDGT